MPDLGAMMSYRAVGNATLAAGAIVFGLLVGSIPASATVYVFNQAGPVEFFGGTGWIIPTFQPEVSGTIEIDGGFDDIPTIHTYACAIFPSACSFPLPPRFGPPIDFGPLISLSLRAGDSGVSLLSLQPFFDVVNGPWWALEPMGSSIPAFTETKVSISALAATPCPSVSRPPCVGIPRRACVSGPQAVGIPSRSHPQAWYS
jgi:hypothetical protein